MKFSLYSSKPNPLSLKSVTIFFGFSGILKFQLSSLFTVFDHLIPKLLLSLTILIYIPLILKFPSLISGTFQPMHKSSFYSLPWYKKESLTLDISISLLVCVSLLSHFSCIRLCVTPQTAAHRAPLSLGFSRQEPWSGLPFPSLMHESEKWKWSCSVVSDS